MQVATFHIDRHPVTNAQFKAFVDATGYAPRDALNFLRDWRNGAPQPGWENKPVTWVSLEDARAYAAWAGKRLPHGWEWQYAAQGTDGRLYPWGDAWRDDAAQPVFRGRALPPPADVGMHPAGASPFGVQDLVGHVWQWTDEFHDEHTRAAIVRANLDTRVAQDTLDAAAAQRRRYLQCRPTRLPKRHRAAVSPPKATTASLYNLFDCCVVILLFILS